MKGWHWVLVSQWEEGKPEGIGVRLPMAYR